MLYYQSMWKEEYWTIGEAAIAGPIDKSLITNGAEAKYLCFDILQVGNMESRVNITILSLFSFDDESKLEMRAWAKKYGREDWLDGIF